MAEQKRVWLYGRIDRGNASQFLDYQMEYLRRWAKEQGWVVMGETREIRSGVFPDRPGLRTVAQAAMEGRMDAVVIQSMTRLCRTLLDAYGYLHHLQAYGVSCISAAEQDRIPVSAIYLRQ